MSSIEKCECRDGCLCEASPGPAAFKERRRDGWLKVCTRCLTGAEKVLLLDKQSNARPFMDYDAMGFVMILGAMMED